MPRDLHWAYLGRLPYREAQDLQESAREEVKRGDGPERLFLLEHPHVYTLGRNAVPEDVLGDAAARGVEVAECDRGGKVTYHGPGQLVGYPVINLSPDRRDIRRYVRDLQESLVRTLALYGIEGEARDGQDFIGVWAGPAKIASIGVHLSRWVTTHGFALNVTTDLTYFGGIVPCGLTGIEITSIQHLTGQSPPLAQVATHYAQIFAEIFDRELVASPSYFAAAAVTTCPADSIPSSP